MLVTKEQETVQQMPQIILKDGGVGNMEDLKNLKEGAVIKLVINTTLGDKAIGLIVNLGSIYTCENCPSNSDCAIMFEILFIDCPSVFSTWLDQTFPHLEGLQFRHLDKFNSIHILDNITIKSGLIEILYRERNRLKRQLQKIREEVQTLTKLSA